MFTEVLYAKKDPTKAHRVSPERRDWVRKESAMILAKNLLARDKTKEDMFVKRMERDKVLAITRDERTTKWLKKTKNSPFAVDLVAEDERIYEENQIRMREAQERMKRIEARKNKTKNEIILKALAEFSDLETLRREKRAIIEEEQRLKALLALERTSQNVAAKSDRLVAERAARQRHAAKSEARRLVYKESLNEIVTEEAQALRKKHALPLSNDGKPFHID